MNSKSFSWEKFLLLPVVGIMRDMSLENVLQILPLYQRVGFTTVEITMNSVDADFIIREALLNYGGQLNVGAGTVCNLIDLAQAIEAGAQFIVTPNLDEQVISYCVRRQIPIFAGAYTPSEVYRAWSLGATVVKVFPAVALGPSYVNELKGPMRQIKVMPTGGITYDNCVSFLDAGASALGIGSSLFDRQLVENQDWAALKNHFEKFIKKINTRANG